jgi:DNA adenine methylase
MRPFLRWAGGKQQIVGKIASLLPAGVHATTYREPFVGAGSLFFALRPQIAHLSDLNAHLINCYTQVRDRPIEVAAMLARHDSHNCSDYYYEQRAEYNQDAETSPAQAARFIYLNRTCFNGIFRVNKNGDFNVPYGRKERPLLPTAKELQAVSDALAGADLRVADFREGMESAKRGDFVYLDPPYPPLNGTSYFTHYTAERFSDEDQRALAAAARDLDRRGCRFLISNADVDLVRDLYQGFHLHELQVTRYITCSQVRHRVSELVITNYLPEGIPRD